MSIHGVTAAGCSECGPVRRENQDAWRIAEHAGGAVLLLLADGMGGHADGAIAANLAVSAALDHLSAQADPGAALEVAVANANRAVAAHRASHGQTMCGTTLVLAVVRGAQARIANVGDSRGYRLRDGNLHQVTLDHSWVAEQRRAGRAEPGGNRNLVTRSISGEPVDADIFELELREGDLILLCSDGVWDGLDDQRIGAVLAGSVPLQEVVDELCRAAVTAGSTDNVTAVAARLSSISD